ncbi:MAG: SusC/RagA family TonB-linked outer membrane protein, partial [Bacteroidota bacterium]
LSYDNRLYSGSSINEIQLLAKSIDRDGNITYNPASGGSDLDFYAKPGTIGAESFSVGSTEDRLYYQGQVNYARSFGKHDITALALMSREQSTSGSEFPHYREDWVGRLTYGYDDRYFLEANGAYNGSERFAAKYRFGFFPSLGLGWMLSNESFIKQPWLDKLKLRYSIGTVGSDNFTSPRWSYNTQWGLDGGDIATFGTTYTNGAIGPGIVGGTYQQLKELVIGNPDLQWEVSQKQNIGLDFSVFNGTFSGTVDVFQDDRSNVFMSASQRASNIYAYFGAAPVAANIGKVQNKGFEISVKLQHTWSGVHCWVDYSFSHSKENVVFAEDPQFRPAYQKSAGFPIGQPFKQVEQPGFNKSWDDLYGSVPYEANAGRLPGDLAVIDFNSDGVINSSDGFRYGFNSRPENTYNITTGVDYKGLSLMVQFFGVYDVSQDFSSILGLSSDSRAPEANILINNYWTPSNPNGVYAISRAGGTGNGLTSSYRGKVFDGSYLRLKNVELAYTFSGKWLKTLNMSSLKMSLSGNNLIFWSKMPDDKEAAVNIYDQTGTTLYPTVRIVKFGLNVTF